MAGAIPKTLRILAFPIKGRTWAFHASLPAVAPESAPGGGLTFAGLWQSLKRAGSLQERAEIVDEWGTQKAKINWAALEKAPPTSIRGRIAGWGNALMRRAHPGEQLLKSIPRDVAAFEIIYPSGLNSTLVRRRVRLLARRGLEHHRWWTYATAAALPFSTILSILPVPNLVQFYNLFRAHANWHAWKGGDTLMKALEHIGNPGPSKSARETDQKEIRDSEAVRSPSDTPSPKATTSSSASENEAPQERSRSVGPKNRTHEDDSQEVSDARPANSDTTGLDATLGGLNATSRGLDASSRNVDEQQADTESDIVGSRHSGRIFFRPSRGLAELVPFSIDDRGIPSLASLSEEHIKRICNDFALDEALVSKWRDTAKVKVV